MDQKLSFLLRKPTATKTLLERFTLTHHSVSLNQMCQQCIPKQIIIIIIILLQQNKDQSSRASAVSLTAVALHKILSRASL